MRTEEKPMIARDESLRAAAASLRAAADALLSALAVPPATSRFVYVEGRGTLVDGVEGQFRVGDDVLIRTKVRGVEGSDATPIKAILLYAGCQVTPAAAQDAARDAAQDAGLTEAERVDLADTIRLCRTGSEKVLPWHHLDTYDQKAALDRADAAAAWFAKRGGAK